MASQKKDVLLIANYWHFQSEKASSRYRSFADLLSKKYDLEVLTSTFCHLTKAQRDVQSLHLDNLPYQVTFQYEQGYSKNISLKRILSYNQFGRNVYYYLKKRKKPELIIVSIPSLTVADLVTKYGKRMQVPVIVDIQDLWPEAFKMAFRTPIISDLLFFPMLKQANRIYRSADEILAVSDTYVARGKKQNKTCKALSIYIGTDSRLVEERIQNISIEKDEQEFWVGYAGALGHSYDIESVIYAIHELKQQGYDDIVFKVMGDGVLRDKFERMAHETGIHCEFTGLLEYGLMMKTLMSCNVAVNPIIGKSVSSIINKVSDYAAAGMPVINTQNSTEYRRLLNEYNAGINVENGNVHEIAIAISRLHNDPELRQTMSEQAKKMFTEKFDRQKNYVKLLSVMDQLMKCDELNIQGDTE